MSATILRLSSSILRPHLQRNLATSSVALQPLDPIQELYVNKIREYAAKKKASGGKLVDADKKTEADLQAQLDNISKKYGGPFPKDMDMAAFPATPKWADPEISV